MFSVHISGIFSSRKLLTFTIVLLVVSSSVHAIFYTDSKENEYPRLGRRSHGPSSSGDEQKTASNVDLVSGEVPDKMAYTYSNSDDEISDELYSLFSKSLLSLLINQRRKIDNHHAGLLKKKLLRVASRGFGARRYDEQQ
ncbi:uncharacterized protein LOC141907579 [Tubulanus polymorphus]|uniref:uncharacterized protein LOC141907579 n=1 Tax=Tubulanus polymorphus TaxID=672921 RepID=UPI003DA59DC5